MGLAQQRRGTIAGAATRKYSDQVLADSPLLYWRLAEASGTTCNDSSGNSRPGTFSASGLTYSQTGAVAGNNAILFDGTAGRIQSNATLDLAAFSVVTIECWMKVAAYNLNDKLLMETSANMNSNNGAFFINPNNSTSSGRFSLALNGAGGVNSWYFAQPSTGVFHHYVFKVITGQAQAFTVRVDKADQTMNLITNNSVSALGNFTVNVACRNAASLFLAATIDEIAIYGGSLSTARTDAHYDAAAVV